jgi:hypothetical protein
MAGEVKRYWHGTTTTMSTTIGALTSGSTVGAAGSLDLGTYTSPADYPHVRFVLGITFATSTGIENKVVELIAREMDVDGTTDTETPTATYRNRIVGVFVLKNVTSLQTLMCDVYDAPREADYYVFQSSGQNSSANATLKATPFTFGPV